MIVDDEPFARTGFKMSVDWRKHGFEVAAEASNGREALEKIGQCRPDVIFTDIKMPVLDGIGLIRAVRASDPQIVTVVLSNYDEFDLVKEAMKAGAEDYFLKVTIDIEKLEAFLDGLREKIETKRDASRRGGRTEIAAIPFFAKEANPVHINNASKVLESDKGHPPLNGALFLITVPGFSDYVESKHGNDLSKAMKLLSSAICSAAACSQNALILFEQNQWALLLNSKSFFSLDAMLASAEGIHLAVQQYLGIDCNIGYGLTYCSEERLKKLLDAAAHPFDRAFYGRSVYRADLVDISKKTLQPAADGLEKLNEKLHKFRLKEIPPAIGELLDQAEASRISPRRFKEYVIRLLMILELKLTSYLPSPAGINPPDYIGRIYLACSADEVRETAMAAAGGILRQIQTAAAGRRKEVAQAVAYIERNYDKKITLQETADSIPISKNYLSTLFKAECGMSFQDYLIKFRMEKAAQLLIISSLRVSEICEKVGYGDIFYFDRSFKRYFNQSPKEFRNSVRSQS